jgi:hypothetical protein
MPTSTLVQHPWRIATADYSRNGKPVDSLRKPRFVESTLTLSCSACPMDPCLGRRQNHLGRLAYTGDRTAFFQKGYCGIMTTNMHERHLIIPEEDNTIRQDIREPSDTVSGKSGSQLLLQWTEVRCRAGWTRGRRWSARHRPDTWVGWLPCRHESRRALERRHALLEISTGNAI